jgi:hypothetical protein
LINAVYFKALWQEPFRKELTSDASFWLEDGSSVAVPMMKARLAVACAQGPGFRCINLPYKGNQMSMLVLLPDSRHGRKDLERALNARLLQSCLRAGTTVEVDLFLPRFRMCPESIDLNRALKAIGMATAFDPEEADFSGINGRQPPDEEALYIGRALSRQRARRSSAQIIRSYSVFSIGQTAPASFWAACSIRRGRLDPKLSEPTVARNARYAVSPKLVTPDRNGSDFHNRVGNRDAIARSAMTS